MLKKLKQRNEGFTIIEVLIVLAIGGLIMLIVFLAVPALQRTQRNNARNNDGSRVAAAVTECLSNRNKTVASCDSAAEINVGTLSELSGNVTFTDGNAGSTTVANVDYAARCNADGSGVVTGAGIAQTDFAVRYQLEGNNPARCVGS